MNAIFFGLKRAFHGTLRITRPMLRALGLTAARYDLLFALFQTRAGRGWALGHRRWSGDGLHQSLLRKRLGVSRPTVSRMLVSLEKLGLVMRHRCNLDRRQLRVALTALGRSVFRKADHLLRRTGWAQLALDSALGADADRFRGWRANRWYDEWHCIDEMSRLETSLAKIRRTFGDVASVNYPWRPDP